MKNNKVAIVIDDLGGGDPPVSSGIRIYGNTDIVIRQDGYMDQTGRSRQYYIRINSKKWGWDIEDSMLINGRFNIKKLKRTKKDQYI